MSRRSTRKSGRRSARRTPRRTRRHGTTPARVAEAGPAPESPGTKGARVSRRDFLGLAVGAGAALACSRTPIPSADGGADGGGLEQPMTASCFGYEDSIPDDVFHVMLPYAGANPETSCLLEDMRGKRCPEGHCLYGSPPPERDTTRKVHKAQHWRWKKG